MSDRKIHLDPGGEESWKPKRDKDGKTWGDHQREEDALMAKHRSITVDELRAEHDQRSKGLQQQITQAQYDRDNWKRIAESEHEVVKTLCAWLEKVLKVQGVMPEADKQDCLTIVAKIKKGSEQFPGLTYPAPVDEI